MKERENPDKDFLALARMKFNNINTRVRHRKSYLAKGIKNLFTFATFLEFARKHKLTKGDHLHRVDRNKHYSPDNLVFISAAEHYRLTGLERRKLDDVQRKEIVELSDNMSLRRLAKQYNVSHITIWRCLKKERDK